MTECTEESYLGENSQDAGTKSNPYEDYEKQTEKLATAAFENHQIRSRGDKRWVIAQKYKDDGSWSCVYQTEIIIGYDGTLITYGDISPVIFRQFGKYSDPLQVVRWVAQSGIPGYLISKAYVGLGASYEQDITKKFDEKAAIWEMQEHIKDRLEELDSDDADELDDEKIAAYRKAIRAVDSESWYFVRQELYDDLTSAGYDDVGEEIWDIGLVPAPRLYYSQAACRKLLELLEKEEQEPQALEENKLDE
ncbi:MAG: hypothetical protein ACYS7Y_16715, partial [Planctomycetota bacterium]